MKRSLLVLQIFAIFRLCHAHVKKDTRVSPLFHTASNGKLGGIWEQGYDLAMFCNAFLDNLLYSAFSLLTPRLTPREFNSYGSRRGNDAVMSRGTFANIRLVNKFMNKAGPKTIHLPSGKGD